VKSPGCLDHEARHEARAGFEYSDATVVRSRYAVNMKRSGLHYETSQGRTRHASVVPSSVGYLFIASQIKCESRE
jgi:hypothetical protein